MNYIKLLESQTKDLGLRLTDYALFMMELQMYLRSSKFHDDNTVNVNDIILRIQEFNNRVYKGEVA
jgi:hypothetical protein